jgi:hypothetical protein
MDIRSVFPSKYIRAADLKGQDVRVVIGQIVMEKVDAEAQPVLYFQGKDKGLVLNKTNSGTIADMYGDETDQWIGKAIVLFPTEVEFKGELKDAIRVRFIQPPPQRNAPVAQPARTVRQMSDNEMNDEVPF